MAAAFIWKTQASRVQHALAREAHRVFEGSASNQAHLPQLTELMLESEGPGGGKFGGIIFRGDFHLDGLFSDGLGEVDLAGKTKGVVRQNRNPLPSVFHHDGPPHPEVAPLPPELPHACLAQQVHKRLAAAVEDRYFEVIHFQPDIVDTEAVERA